MTEDGLAALQEQLRDTPPAGVSSLAGDHLHHLADAVRTARHRQAAELQAAGDQAFKYIPRLLRAPIRKIVGG